MKEHEKERKIENGLKTCKHCNVSFVSNQALIGHCRSAHGNETLGFTCNECGKQVSSLV